MTKRIPMTPSRLLPADLERFKTSAVRLGMSQSEFIVWMLDATEDMVDHEEKCIKELIADHTADVIMGFVNLRP